mmetsp:Transcript_97810/g.281411  ORF Transcript_97810/g.281411 Transcript_97810/m.281411 type:complete len:220 (+) Transcript_97810:349-1008(+)
MRPSLATPAPGHRRRRGSASRPGPPRRSRPAEEVQETIGVRCLQERVHRRQASRWRRDVCGVPGLLGRVPRRVGAGSAGRASASPLRGRGGRLRDRPGWARGAAAVGRPSCPRAARRSSSLAAAPASAHRYHWARFGSPGFRRCLEHADRLPHRPAPTMSHALEPGQAPVHVAERRRQGGSARPCGARVPSDPLQLRHALDTHHSQATTAAAMDTHSRG